MSEFAAAYGLAHLDDLDSIITHNKLIHQTYLQEFSEFDEISFLDYNFDGISNYQYVVAKVSANIRDSLVKYFIKKEYFFGAISTLVAIIWNHTNPKKYVSINLPNTEQISSEIIIFPTGKQVTPQDVHAFLQLFKVSKS